MRIQWGWYYSLPCQTQYLSRINVRFSNFSSQAAFSFCFYCSLPEQITNLFFPLFFSSLGFVFGKLCWREYKNRFSCWISIIITSLFSWTRTENIYLINFVSITLLLFWKKRIKKSFLVYACRHWVVYSKFVFLFLR